MPPPATPPHLVGGVTVRVSPHVERDRRGRDGGKRSRGGRQGTPAGRRNASSFFLEEQEEQGRVSVEDGVTPEPPMREGVRLLGESQELLARLEPLLWDNRVLDGGAPPAAAEVEEGREGSENGDDTVPDWGELSDGAAAVVLQLQGVDLPVEDQEELEGPPALEDSDAEESDEDEQQWRGRQSQGVPDPVLHRRLARLRSMSPEGLDREEEEIRRLPLSQQRQMDLSRTWARDREGVQELERGRRSENEGEEQPEEQVEEVLEAAGGHDRQEEVVHQAQEEVDEPVQEGREEVGHRGRRRGRGRGRVGRDRAGGARQEERAQNCLPVCPEGCRGLSPACLAVATPTRGTPRQSRRRGRGRGREGHRPGTSRASRAQHNPHLPTPRTQFLLQQNSPPWRRPTPPSWRRGRGSKRKILFILK